MGAIGKEPPIGYCKDLKPDLKAPSLSHVTAQFVPWIELLCAYNKAHTRSTIHPIRRYLLLCKFPLANYNC
jgi:hypothetical protein